MNKLWAPWRSQYIHRRKNPGCIFCQIFREDKDAKNFVLARYRHCFAVLNTFPYNNGHILIVSNRHAGSLEKLKPAEILDMHKLLLTATDSLKKTLKPDGFNIGINIGENAGAGIKDHIHIHIVPRWAGDTNFMPIITDTKIISQSLEELYRLLVKNNNLSRISKTNKSKGKD
ncbi:MAG: HIT domain-containing protein [Candidatus Omnitrophica bacterium]|nr:HIT domain-containing protein [Candidatus Omnitrophota bacterium]MDD5429722.1 HIT domain-containing protein [Candidatus Omnitrophota bacterium]